MENRNTLNICLLKLEEEDFKLNIEAYFALIVDVLLVLTLVVLFLTFLYMIYGKETPAETTETGK